MPDDMQIVRGVVGSLCVIFAHLLGRAVAKRDVAARTAQTYRWALRTFVAGLAVMWGSGLDALAITVYSLSAVAAAAGVYLSLRPKKREEEDLSKQLFPKD